jgi:hypothetical protein
MTNIISKCIAVVLFISGAGCAINVTKLYEGSEQPRHTLALYSPLNRGDFSGPSIQTLQIYGKPLGEHFPRGPIGPYIGLKPGKTSVRISFDDYDDAMLWAIAPGLVSLKHKNFQGWYDLQFEAKPNKLYAPIFNYNLPDSERKSEMCIAELSQDASVAESRNPQPYVACAKPTIPATPENIKLCSEIRHINSATRVYAENCRLLGNPN